ncbi:hypothetical protein PLESTM_001477300 [Pleodorina starrii]|nr:hypothetical protein PLESTM_001477300 [Pleodorina starrii]
MRQNLRVDIAAAEAAAASDNHGMDDDPQRLLKLSHSLRYQLGQPLRRQQDTAAPLPGVLRNNSPQATPQQPSSGRDQSSPHAQHPQHPHLLPPLNGPGTKGGPYNGFASTAWLQGEVRQDLDDLRRHVDEYVSNREQRAFDVERTALKAEIAHLRKRLAESDAQVVRLKTMLPDEEGEFKALKAELEELEREADQFCDLYEREAKATGAALEGYRQALADITDIETEFQRIRQIIDAIPEAAAQAHGHAQAPLYGGAPPKGANQGPPGSPEAAASSRGCCGCFRFRRRR